MYETGGFLDSRVFVMLMQTNSGVSAAKPTPVSHKNHKALRHVLNVRLWFTAPAGQNGVRTTAGLQLMPQELRSRSWIDMPQSGKKDTHPTAWSCVERCLA